MSFFFYLLVINDIISQLVLYKDNACNYAKELGGYSEEVPPLTIPNREVKLE